MIAILGKMAKGKPEADEESVEGEPESEGPSLSDMAAKKAASKVLAAIEAGDAGALAKALQASYEACSGE